MAVSSNTRIAKNTLFLYVRTLLVLVVSLYTSRLVLQVLGAVDLGIYNVVGGVVALMSFLQTAQTKATSRFITYEIGKDSDEKKLKRVFSVCITIHVILAIIVVILGETIGLWMVINWTDIPIDRQNAAMWVYQFSIFVLLIHIIRVPYDAVIVAYEKMSVFAFLSIFEASILLGFVLFIFHCRFDSLILYSGLVALSAVLLYLAYFSYIRLYKSIFTFSFCWDKEYSQKILSFSGWTLLGSGMNTGSQQGVNLLFNNYVGLIANAAIGFASQVNIAVGKFVNGFSTAFTPQIIKLYAQKDIDALHLLMCRASKFSFVLCYMMALPLIANMDFVLHLWLGANVPPYTCVFCQMILMCTVIDSTSGVLNTAITATGTIRKYQMLISISFSFDFFFCLLMFISGVSPSLVFASRILTRGFINMMIGLHCSHNLIQFDVFAYVRKVLIPIFVTLIVSVPLVWGVSLFTEGWIHLFYTVIASFTSVSVCLLFVIMNSDERRTMFVKICSILKK